jgi:hypothetical protein
VTDRHWAIASQGNNAQGVTLAVGGCAGSKVIPKHTRGVAKKMKRLIMASAMSTLCFGAVLSIPLHAQTQEQQPSTSAPAAGASMEMEKADKVAQVLNLSPQQQSQLQPILEAEAPKVKAINQDPNLSPSEKKSKLKAVHDETDPLVKSILTPVQYKQWETIRKSQLEKLK